MLIAHLLVKTRMPPRATDVTDEGVAEDTSEPVHAPYGAHHLLGRFAADSSAPI
jgi:hypothetical protein